MDDIEYCLVMWFDGDITPLDTTINGFIKQRIEKQVDEPTCAYLLFYDVDGQDYIARKDKVYLISFEEIIDDDSE